MSSNTIGGGLGGLADPGSNTTSPTPANQNLAGLLDPNPQGPGTGPAPTSQAVATQGLSTVIDIITNVAHKLKIPAELALAIAAHESGFNYHAMGDVTNGNATSFGLFQLHQGGELGKHDRKWANNPLNNAMTALKQVAAVYHKNPNLDWGTIAALAQRPANPGAYAQDVNDILRRSGRGQHAIDYFNHGYNPSQFGAFDPNTGVGGDPGLISGKSDFTGQIPASLAATAAGAAPAAAGVKNTIGTTGAGTSFGSGAGTSGAGGTAADTINPTTTVADFKASLASSGFAQALINSDPSLKRVFQQAITKQWYLSDTGISNFEAAIRNTKWWSSRSQAQRNFDELQFSDPKQFSNQLGQQADKLSAAATQMGVTLNPGDVAALAKLSLRNGLSDQEVNNALAGHFNYQDGQAYTGQSGTTVDSIKQLAQQYYAPATNDQIQKWVQQVDSGQMDPKGLEDYFKQQAMSMFPYLKPQLDAGQTVESVANQYKSQMAQTLELDPNGIANNDTTVMKGLQMRNQDGSLGLMPLYQYDQMLKQDPRWLQTEGAKNSLVGLGSSLLKQWGVLA